MVEGAALEMRCTRKGTVSSNLTPTALRLASLAQGKHLGGCSERTMLEEIRTLVQNPTTLIKATKGGGYIGSA